VKDVVERLVTALGPEDVVIGGGNIIHLKKLPRGCRAGNNAHAFIGGFRMWNNTYRANFGAMTAGIKLSGKRDGDIRHSQYLRENPSLRDPLLQGL
jgi:polyphosphate glucokinase